MHHLRVLPFVVFALLSVGNAANLTGTDELIGYDKRHQQQRVAPAAAQTQAGDVIKARVHGAKIDLDSHLGTPKWIHSLDENLTGPAGEGKGVSAQHAARFKGQEHRAVKAFVEEHKALFGHGAEVFDNAVKTRDHIDTQSGVRMTAWQQRLDNIPLYESIFIAHESRAGELMSVSSLFVPDVSRAAVRGTPGRAAILRRPQISARRALEIAIATVGEEFSDITALDAQPQGDEQVQNFHAKPLPGDATARLVWFAVDRDTLRLCWQTELNRRKFKERFRVLVDVQNGEVVLWRKLTVDIQPVTYKVFTNDSPTPMRPGWPTPSPVQPPAVAATLVTLPAISTNASPLGWLNDGELTLRGNNIDCRLDRDGDDRADMPRVQGVVGTNGLRRFDFPLNISQHPSNYSAAASVQLFYWCNFMHDRLYDIGFVESKGNYQKDNLGRDGIGNDPVVADAQDGSGFNNANFTPAPDGVPGRIQMYIFNGPNPAHDGDLDAEVILHEYTHGMSDRRVGHGVGISQFQSFGLSEGWSDFFAEAMLTGYDHDIDGTYPMGGYASYLLSGLQESYYYGIRRYPYTTRTNISPLVFTDIDPSQAAAYPGIPRSPIATASPSEVHRQGEVWCLMLWEVRAALLRRMNLTRQTYPAANDFVMKLIADGMDWTPPNPSFVQARDGIIAADRAMTGGTNAAQIWTAFAKRGLGVGAQANDVTTTSGITGSFALPSFPVLSVNSSVVEFSGNVGGTFVPRTNGFQIINQTFDAVAWSISGIPPWLKVTPTNGTLLGAKATNVFVLTNNFNDLPQGTTNIALVISNSATTNISTVVVSIRVGGALDSLSVTPISTFAIGGPVGGPFSPTNRVYTLQSSDFVVWRASNVPPWLTISPTNGTLDIGESVDINVGVNNVAAALKPAGIYSGTFSFVNSATGVRVDLAATLQVGQQESYVEDFNTRPLDLQYSTITFTPAAGWFTACTIPATNFPTDPAGGTVLSGLGDDEYRLVNLPPLIQVVNASADGQDVTLITNVVVPSVPFFGHRTNAFWIGANGNVTPDPGPNTDHYYDSEFDFFSQVRIAPYYMDLNPAAGGTVSWLRLADRVAVTWQDVPQYGTTSSNNVQLELFYDGTVRMTWLNLNLPAPSPYPVGIVGLSTGEGMPLNFVQSDLSAEQACAASGRILAPASVREGEVGITAALSLSPPPTNDMVVTLSSDNTNAVVVPRTVVVRAGHVSETFAFTAVDDHVLDGTEFATITAEFPDRAPATAVVAVNDNSATAILVSIPPEATEGAGVMGGQGYVLLGTNGVFTPAGHDVTVTLESSDPMRVSVPPAMIVPAGSFIGTFDLTILDDSLLNGDSPVEITASVANWQYDHDTILVHDNESYALDISLIPQIAEGFAQSTNIGMVSVRGIPLVPITVNVVSEMTNVLVPLGTTNIIIPAGATNVSFAAQVYNNSQLNTYSSVRIFASATNYHPFAGNPWFTNFLSATGSIVIIDDERPTAPISPDPANGLTHVPTVPMLAWNMNPAPQPPSSVVFDIYLGTSSPPATLMASNVQGNDYQIRSPLLNGVTYYWRVVAHRTSGTNLYPASSDIWSFTTSGFDHFTVEPVPSPQPVGQPFNVTVTARDEYDMPLRNFSGTARLSNAAPAKTASTIAITEIDTADFDRIEFQNVCDRTINIAGWEIICYDWTTWPNPAVVFPIPGPNISNPGEVFQLRTLVPRLAPGAYPTFVFSTNVFWNNNASNNPIAVMLRDNFGNIVDFVCAADTDPAQITVPRRITTSDWNGSPVPVNLNSTLSYLRVGNRDNNNAADWTVGPKTVGTNNVGFYVPFTNYATVPMTAPPVTAFLSGTGVVAVTVFEEARPLVLTAWDSNNRRGPGAQFDVLADNDVSVSLAAPNTVTIYDALQCRIIVTNSGAQPAIGVMVTNRPPPLSQFMSASSTLGACALVGNEIVCDLGLLAGHSAASIVVITKPTTFGSVTNFAVVGRADVDAYPANNSASIITLAALPQISIIDVTNSEPFGTSPVSMDFAVRLSVPSTATTTVHFATSDGLAVAGLDYIATNGTLTFLPGTTSQIISVPILPDSISESNETLSVTLSAPVNAQVTRSIGIGTIVDNDPVPTISVSDVTITEGSQPVAAFNVTLSAASAKVVTIGYVSIDGSAVAGFDYLPVYGVLTFALGVTNQTLTVPVLADDIFEPTKTFFIVLSNPGNGILGKSQGTCTILDDDTNVLHHLAFDSLPPVGVINVPLSIQGSARDAVGRVFPNFTSPVHFTATGNETVRPAGTNNFSWNFPFGAGFHDSRAEVLYFAGELGLAGEITSLALDVTAMPGQTLSNFTIRIKPTGAGQIPASSWDDSGWITNFQSDVTIVSTGWVSFVFRTPYLFDGITNLLVDFSFNNSSYSSDGVCRSSGGPGQRSLIARSDSAYGNPLDWSGSVAGPALSTNFPNARFTIGNRIVVAPDTTTTTGAGFWNATVAFGSTGTNISLRAVDDTGHSALYTNLVIGFDPLSNVRITGVARGPNGTLLMTVRSVAGARCILEGTASLPASWTSVGQPVTADVNGDLILFDRPVGPAKFYRVRLVP